MSGKTYELGAGLAWPINPNLDFVGTLSYVKVELDVPFFGDLDDDGLGLGAGLRGRVIDALELNGGLKYVSFNEGGDDTTLFAGARYFFTQAFAAGLDVDFDDDGTTWMLGARLKLFGGLEQRRTSGTLMPDSPSFKIATICDSLNFDFFIDPPEIRKVYFRNVCVAGELTNRFEVANLSAASATWAPVAGTVDTSKRILMTSSPDGGTLFIAGSDAVLIEPAQ